MWLALMAILKLAVIFPEYPEEEQLVALPLSLLMGWVESVPYFCAGTKMVANIANNILARVRLPPHPLEELANTPPPEEQPTVLTNMMDLLLTTSHDKS